MAVYFQKIGVKMRKQRYKSFIDEIDERVSGKLFYKFLVVLVVFYFLIIFCSQAFYSNFAYISISGESMQNTLNPNPVVVSTNKGEELMQDGVYIRFTNRADYNDIAIIRSNLPTTHETIIKRVMAQEGDFVTIAKVPNINGGSEFRFMRVKKNSAKVEVIYEDYIKSYQEWNILKESIVDDVSYEQRFYEAYQYYNYNTKTFKVSELGNKNVTFFEVPEGQFFFMGDNRAYSSDARVVGTYKYTDIIGKVVQIVHNGTKYKNNNKWWINRTLGVLNVCWKEVLRFFGAKL